MRNDGFSLVEMLVTLGILGVVASTVVTGMLSTTRLNTQTEQRLQATVAAQRVLDELRSLDPSSLPVSGQSAVQSVPVGGRTYSVTLRYCSGTPNYCGGNARQILATVQLAGSTVFTAETVFTSVNTTLGSVGTP